jgi:hypothetical protein
MRNLSMQVTYKKHGKRWEGFTRESDSWGLEENLEIAQNKVKTRSISTTREDGTNGHGIRMLSARLMIAIGYRILIMYKKSCS